MFILQFKYRHSCECYNYVMKIGIFSLSFWKKNETSISILYHKHLIIFTLTEARYKIEQIWNGFNHIHLSNQEKMKGFASCVLFIWQRWCTELTALIWKNEKSWTWVNFNSFILIKCTFSSWVIFNLVFLSV